MKFFQDPEIVTRMIEASGSKNGTELARKWGIKKQSITNYRKRMPASAVVYFCEKFNQSVDYIVTGKPNDRFGDQHLIAIPVISTVPAGPPRDIWDSQDVKEWVHVANVEPSSYALEVDGDSMEPTLHHGEVVVCHFSEIAANNKIVVCRNEWGEYMLKRLKRKDDGTISLCSDNPDKSKFPPIKPNGWKVVGIALWAIPKKRKL